MFIKTGVSKIVVKDVFHTFDDLSSFIKTARKDSDAKQLLSKIASYAPIKANPQNYLYIRNRAISGEETHGPNQNWDGFPSEEIVKGYRTFINVPNTVDHINTGKDEEVIGMVLDSSYIPKQLYRPSTGELFPFKETTALKNDQIIGDWVENLWAIDKKLAEQHTPGLVEGILSGEISDSSMGALVEMSKCSICGNESSSPDDYCEHISGNNKGQFFEVNGVKRKSYEKNYGLTFFEDTLILSEAFAKKAGTRASAGGEGADANAKLLEIVAIKHPKESILPYIRRANVPSSLPQSQQNQQRGQETIKIGDSPEDYEEKKEEIIDENASQNTSVMDGKDSSAEESDTVGKEVIYQGKEFTVDSVSVDPKTKQNVYKLSNETGSVEVSEEEIEFKSEEEEMIKKQKNLSMKDLIKRTAVLKRKIALGRPRPMGELASPQSKTTRNYAGQGEDKNSTAPVKYSYNDEVFYSAYEDEDDKYYPKFGPLVDKFWKSYYRSVKDRDENRNDREKEKELFFKFLKDNNMSNRDANLFAGVASDSMNLHEFAGFLKDGEGTFAKKKGYLEPVGYLVTVYSLVDPSRDLNEDHPETEETEYEFNLSEASSPEKAKQLAKEKHPFGIYDMFVEELYPDYDRKSKKKTSLQNRIERIRARMNQKNIDERFESREADAETFGFESADKILKDSPRYSSDPMPYKVNSRRRRAVNYPNKIDFSYDAEIKESFCKGSEAYDALGALSESEWQEYLDEMAVSGVTVSYDSVEDCYIVEGMQAGKKEGKKVRLSSTGPLYRLNREGRLVDDEGNVCFSNETFETPNEAEKFLLTKKEKGTVVAKSSNVQLGLKETLGTIKKEFTDTIKTLAIERGIDQKDFYYTSKQLGEDFNNYLVGHKTLALAIRTGSIKRSEVAALLPVSLREITEELSQSGYKISQYIQKVRIGATDYQPGEAVTVDNKTTTTPEAEGNIEEVGMIQGQDGQQHPSVKINDQWYSDEDHLISKDSSLEDLRDNRKAIAELEEENLFDELVSTGEIEKEAIPKKTPTIRESRKVSQARLLLANRNKGTDETPSEVLHRRNNFNSSLDSGNFFMD